MNAGASSSVTTPGRNAEIVLATLNARYSHASMGLRCLRANLGALRERSVLVEGTLQTQPLDFVHRLLSYAPKIIGLGVYVWNAELSAAVVALLKKVAPDVLIIVGGPEVSHEVEQQPICGAADHVVRGEGEVAFANLCQAHLDRSPLQMLPTKIVDGGTPALAALCLPYDEYTEEDLAQRTVYLEASRGCPFRCAFCLSALDKKVRPFALDRFLAACRSLHQRGLRRFKFVDRTFNLAIDDALAILHFFFELGTDDIFLHFEMIPDRLPDALLEVLALFPAGAVQLEVGIQTFNPDVAKTIQRRTDLVLAVDNLQKLRAQTAVHVHADLIAGLPGESLESFAAGFDALLAAGPHEIQLGILKRLRGTPLTSLPEITQVQFDDCAPYEVLSTPALDFETLMEFRRIARIWETVFNRGRFARSAELLQRQWAKEGSVFAGLRRFTSKIWSQEEALHGVALLRLAEHVHTQLLTVGFANDEAEAAIVTDYCQDGTRRRPPFLDGKTGRSSNRRVRQAGPPPRQQRHLDARVD